MATMITNKRNPLIKVFLVGSLAFGLTACTNEEQGTVFGAILGGVVGSTLDGGGRHGRHGGSGAGMRNSGSPILNTRCSAMACASR